MPTRGLHLGPNRNQGDIYSDFAYNLLPPLFFSTLLLSNEISHHNFSQIAQRSCYPLLAMQLIDGENLNIYY